MKLAFQKGLLSARVSASVMGLGLVLAAGQTLALTPAGTDINNRATVTYEDANGNEYSAQSNESTVTVAEVHFATLEEDGEKFGAPGETVYFPHTLKNTGNAQDTYNLGAVDDDSAANYTVYLDENGNGVPDAGESVVTSLSLDADETAELVVAVPVPAGASAGDEIDSTLTVSGTGVVDDLTANDGTDGLEGTNNDKVTVTTDAVLQLSKTAVPDFQNNTITYTLQVKNNGGRAAQDVDIFDAIPANATFVSVDNVNGLLGGGANPDQYLDSTGNLASLPNGYAAEADLAELDEDGIDLNGNGDPTDSAIKGISFRDRVLGVNTTVSIVYTVSFDPTAAAGTEIKNTFAAQGNLDGDNGTTEDAVKSNTVTTVIGQIYGVDANDTEIAPDTTDDDVFTVASAPSGAVVDFQHTITNNGNGNDVFELSVDTAGSTFPAGTTYSFWNAAGTVQITDTNSDGNPDTGSLGAGNALDITVKADLPANIGGAVAPYAYTLTATSAGDNDESDDTQGVLQAINAANVDIANSATATGLGDSTVDADANTGTPTNTNDSVAVGGTTSFPLFVANESGNPQSFLLGATLPADWTVVFKEVGIDTGDGAGGPPDGILDNVANAGNVVTATPNLPGGAVYHYTAEVKVSSDVSNAKADYDGGDAVNTNDSDGDYPVTFTVTSASDSSITDSKLDAVDVDANRNVSVTPDGAGQVQPGGNIDYTHVIANGGNTTEQVEISGVNSLSADGWNNNTQLFVIGTGWVQLNNLSTGTVTVRAPNGAPVDIEIDNSGANPLMTLEPGVRLDVRVTVFAPSNAPAGTVDTYTLTASNANVSDVATDNTEVVIGQVRLDKQAAIDTACDCAGGTWPAPGDFEPVQSNTVEPGQCVVWQLTATNEGATDAENVVITDEETEFTTLRLADAATVASTGNTVTNTGTSPEVEWEIGQLVPGDSARTQFCVEVN